MKVEFNLYDNDSVIRLIPETIEESSYLTRTAIRANIKESNVTMRFMAKGTQEFLVNMPHYKSRVQKCLSDIDNKNAAII